jgi:hypothetical protein
MDGRRLTRPLRCVAGSEALGSAIRHGGAASHASVATRTSATASSGELPKAEHDLRSGTSAIRAASSSDQNRAINRTRVR